MSKAADVDLIAVTKRYGDTLAVDAVDLHIPAGTYCCLLGPSGCGKTSTLRMIAGHEAITEGEIVVGGERVNDQMPAQRGTAMMFQEYALFPHLDCRDNVAFSLKMRGVAKAERHDRAESFLRLVRMADLTVWLSQETGVPVIDGVVRRGQAHRGAYAAPLAKN